MKDSFLNILQQEGKKPYFEIIINKLEIAEKEAQVLPEQINMFRAFDFFQVHETKVVILGQDPYHTVGYADGLAFSTGNGKITPSLRNVFAEIKKDYPQANLSDTSLISWAKQGVLLLNTVLTVSEGKTNSHKDFGWDKFTKEVLLQVVRQNPDVIILALGKQAEKFIADLPINKENIIVTSHPSPYSYKKGFENSHVFKQVNDKLIEKGIKAISWDTAKED
ncbi:uracil-DNA glycosylase [Mycoplasma seminis]|uniref:Uracil-DNA glycosylase n=1 Tax=Mycoplasma seminis TaxID=512749 RepID=A0ABY9HBB1_9MOLU|nr:uracil-DNA glycosylase [Mycoplasma seminis]WLP85892.1 uracil-DNA glycosylase [Mycoplasma seminis]